MASEGMDVERVHALVSRLEIEAGAINGVIGVVDGVVGALAGLWFGHNFEALHGGWVGGQKAQAHGAAVDISAVVKSLRAEIAQQQGASDASGAAPSAAFMQAVEALGAVTIPASRVNDPRNKGWVYDNALLAKGVEAGPGGLSSLEAKGFTQVHVYSDKSGFHAALYSFTASDGTTHYVLSFDGTNFGDFNGDDHTDALNAAGHLTPQYQEAADLARQLQAKYGDDLSFTGHSLGGGLAEQAARATGLPAITFNAAAAGSGAQGYADGVRPGGVDPGQVTSFASPDNGIPGTGGNAHGQLITLQGTDHYHRNLSQGILVQDYKAEGYNHGMDHVMADIQGDQSSYWDDDQLANHPTF